MTDLILLAAILSLPATLVALVARPREMARLTGLLPAQPLTTSKAH
ncbi:MAG TPA: hypothetical protein VIV06_05540 [Candidatus Limnocylindrales bacterium]